MTQPNQIVSIVQVVVQMLTSTLSMICSGTLALMIVRSSAGKLNTPYKRYVLGMCIGDMCQSFGLIIGPLMVPRQMSSILGIALGNTATCDIDGTLVIFGILCTCLYLLGLIFSYLCMIKYHVSNQIFLRKWDKLVHFFALGYPFSCCIYLVLSKSLNATHKAGLCFILQSPLGCIGAECRGFHNRKQAFVLVYIAGLVIIIIIFTVMAMIVHHVIDTEKIHVPRSSTTAVTTGTVTNTTSTLDLSRTFFLGTRRLIDFIQSPFRFIVYLRTQDPLPRLENDTAQLEEDTHEQEDDEMDYDLDFISQTNSESLVVYDSNSRVYRQKQRRKLIITSALLYIGSITFTYLTAIISGFCDFFNESYKPNAVLTMITFTLFPLGGVMYIYAHTWMKIRILRKREQRYSWIRAFIAVIVAGAELPKSHEHKNIRVHERGLFGTSGNSNTLLAEQYDDEVECNFWSNIVGHFKRNQKKCRKKQRYKKKVGYVIRRCAADLPATFENKIIPTVAVRSDAGQGNTKAGREGDEQTKMLYFKKEVIDDHSTNDDPFVKEQDQEMQSFRLQWLMKNRSIEDEEDLESPIRITTTSSSGGGSDLMDRGGGSNLMDHPSSSCLMGISTPSEIHQKYSINIMSRASSSSSSDSSMKAEAVKQEND